MKPYSILIHGSGPCGEGTEQSADIALTGLLQQLQTAGHQFESVSMVIDGSAVPIIGALKEHPGLASAADPDAVTLSSLSRQLSSLDKKFTFFMTSEKKEDAEERGPKQQPPKKKRGSESLSQQPPEEDAKKEKEGGAPKPEPEPTPFPTAGTEEVDNEGSTSAAEKEAEA